jgi:hypothetical protein
VNGEEESNDDPVKAILKLEEKELEFIIQQQLMKYTISNTKMIIYL